MKKILTTLALVAVLVTSMSAAAWTSGTSLKRLLIAGGTIGDLQAGSAGSSAVFTNVTTTNDSTLGDDAADITTITGILNGTLAGATITSSAAFDLDMADAKLLSFDIGNAMATAFSITESAVPYLVITTSTGTEAITFGGTADDPNYNFAGTGELDIAGTLDVEGAADIKGTLTLSGGLTVTGPVIGTGVVTYTTTQASLPTNHIVYLSPAGTSFTYTLATADCDAAGDLGRTIQIKCLGTGALGCSSDPVTIATAGGTEYIDDLATYTMSVDYEAITLVCRATSNWNVH